MSSQESPKVGTGVWIVKDGKVLLGKRYAGTQAGTWCTPGGKLEMFEDIATCTEREVKEECGLSIKNIRFITVTNDIYHEVGKHFVTFVYVAEWAGGEPQTLEPDKIGEWGWYAWENLPEPLLLSTRNFIKSGYNPLNFPDK